MSNRTLIMYEISQKQNYILRTNRLLENTGGSYIIRDLTEDPHKFFNKLVEKNIINRNIVLPSAENKIVGGGSAAYIFDSEDKAQKFAKVLSSTIVQYFPGVELFLVKKTIDWESETLFNKKGEQGVIQEMRDQLANKKDSRQSAIFQKSWGIHQACPNTGFPANKYVKNNFTQDKEYLADEVYMKEQVGLHIRDERYEERFIEKSEYPLKTLDNDTYRFMEQKDIEEIFKHENEDSGKSYLSIIALDGNAMGVKVQKFLSQNFKTNNEYIKEYKDITKKIDTAYSRAYQKTIKNVMEQVDNWAKDIYGKRIENENYYKRMKKVIPIRPVILSGDDVSFITLGMLGLEVARIYIQHLQGEEIQITKEDKSKVRMNACAGVAVIPHRYPFWLGYKLADDLCEHAKERLQKDAKYWRKIEEPKYDTSLIDWQIIQTGGSIGNLSDFRKENYHTKDGARLTMRPYYVQHPCEKEHFANYEKSFYRAMDVIEKTIEASEKEDSNYPGRSKWKELRDIYHRGKDAVNNWVLLNQFFALDDPKEKIRVSDQFYFSFASEDSKKSDYGFRLNHDKTVNGDIDYAFYYDALEAM